MQGVLKSRKRAFYIHGSPGTGKTTVVKHVLNQFEDTFNSEIVYVNCERTTPNQALKEIHDVICGETSRKLPSSTLVSEILKKRIKDRNVALVITLDNFDKMEHVENLLWKIHTISFKFQRFGLILISTSRTDLKFLIGNRLYDRLNPSFYEFQPYDARRLFEIIKSRIKEAYGREIAEERALWRFSNFVAENGGNVRRLFSLFLDAIELAERWYKKRVNVKIVEEILKS